MISMMKSMAKTAMAVVDIPVALVSDAATLGGVLVDKEGGSTFTGDAARRLVKNVSDITDPKT